MKPLYLAPMEDVTDPAFRALCKRYGADRVYTEFVNADALVRDIASTTRKLTISDAERPVAIQIYGREPEAMRDAALIVEQAKPDFIDINFGCPVKKVAGKGAGAGLLRDVPKMLEIGLRYYRTRHSRPYPLADVPRRSRLDTHRRSQVQPAHTYTYNRERGRVYARTRTRVF